jgi:hypothetical protein
MRYLEREIRSTGNASKLAYYDPNWTRYGAPLLDLLGAEVDHMRARSAGGPNDFENLATACHKCNIRKSAAHLDKWEQRAKEKPVKGKYGEPEHWDGLSTLFVLLALRHVGTLTKDERKWLEALRQVPAAAPSARGSQSNNHEPTHEGRRPRKFM